VKGACDALLEHDVELANQVILGDRQINREIRELDRMCHAFVVRHLPSAGHLRFVSAVLRIDVAIERVGDYASTIARQIVQFSEPLTKKVAADTAILGQSARQTLGDALRAFNEGDVELARQTFGHSEQTDHSFQKGIRDLVRAGEREKRPLVDILGMVQVLNLLKRVAEQAENICVETVFTVEGRTLDPKVFRIHFVDRDNSCASQMAEAFARKAYPESGRYSSSGLDPAKELSPRLVEFLDGNGVDTRDLEPRLFQPLEEVSPHYHVVVGLDPEVVEAVGKPPFRTVFLHWDIGGRPANDKDRTEERLTEIYRDLGSRVRGLMETLRGPDAD
jgi:phosphate transport system protein